MECLNCEKEIPISVSFSCDENVDFIRCPHCNAKNIVKFLPVNSGPDEFYLDHFELD